MRRCWACGASPTARIWRSCSRARSGTFASPVPKATIRRSGGCIQRHWLERAARDLYRLDPVGLPDTRPWLDHGADPTGYPFLPVEGEHLHQVPGGPVHAGIIEPGHFRFTCDGETVVRLEQRLGYVHRGIEAADGRRGAARGGTAGGAHLRRQHGCLRACLRPRGSAGGRPCTPPPRAVWLRAVMAELERLANHLGDVRGDLQRCRVPASCWRTAPFCGSAC